MEKNRYDEEYFERIFTSFQVALKSLGKVPPAVSLMAQSKETPFSVLISTLISLRTKDEVTLVASKRLLDRAPNAFEMIKLTPEEVEQLIFPAGFYHRKAVQILNVSSILVEKYNGEVPSNLEDLLALPGVGIKTANLTLNLGFGIDAICVDCHVHQITNRLGWVDTRFPEETEKALQKVMPKRFWIPLNELLVCYGQEICTSVSPKCSLCPECSRCPKHGVQRTR